MLKSSVCLFCLFIMLNSQVWAGCGSGRNMLSFHGSGNSDNPAALLLFSTTATIFVAASEMACGVKKSGSNRGSRTSTAASATDERSVVENERPDTEDKLNHIILPHFIENYEKIKEESAKGSGENLQALASLYGCHESVYTQFMKMLRTQYLTIYQDHLDQQDKVHKIHMYIQLDEMLNPACKL